MRINDNNTLEDILSVVYCLEIDVHETNPEFNVNDQFDELFHRIELKLDKKINQIRKNWFSLALEHAKKAKVLWEDENPKESDKLLRKCEKYLRDGNKAYRRKTNFIVGNDAIKL